MRMTVLMIIICFVPAGDHLREAWRIERRVELQDCLTMNQLFSGGGKAGAVTVRCGTFSSGATKQ